eukprot:246592-Amorphochlora_amoeboformis.AAC.1
MQRRAWRRLPLLLPGRIQRQIKLKIRELIHALPLHGWGGRYFVRAPCRPTSVPGRTPRSHASPSFSQSR